MLQVAFDQTAYTNEFNRQSYDRISLMLPKGKRAMLKAYAEKNGISVNSLIVQAIEEYTGIPMTKDWEGESLQKSVHITQYVHTTTYFRRLLLC